MIICSIAGAALQVGRTSDRREVESVAIVAPLQYYSAAEALLIMLKYQQELMSASR